MAFSAEFDRLPWETWKDAIATASVRDVQSALDGAGSPLVRFARLVSAPAGEFLEPMCQASRRLTLQRFGKVMRFFAPLYLSNECVNNCKYCGFSRDNPIFRVTLSVEEVVREAMALKQRGFRHILLVSGEHPRFAPNNYIADCVAALREAIPSVSLEVGPMEEPEVPAHGGGRGRGSRRLPGNLRPCNLQRSAYGGSEEGFRLAARYPGARLRRRIPPSRRRSIARLE